MSDCPGLIRIALNTEDFSYVTLILALTVPTILLLAISLILVAMWKKKFGTESGVAETMESDRDTVIIRYCGTIGECCIIL